jgi:hypothetical protein
MMDLRYLPVWLSCRVQLWLSELDTIEPFSATAHTLCPTSSENIDSILSAIPEFSTTHRSPPSRLLRIMPPLPPTHNRLPSGVPSIVLRSAGTRLGTTFQLPLLARLINID